MEPVRSHSLQKEPTLDLRLLATRTARQKISVVFCWCVVLCYRDPRKLIQVTWLHLLFFALNSDLPDIKMCSQFLLSLTWYTFDSSFIFKLKCFLNF